MQQTLHIHTPSAGFAMLLVAFRDLRKDFLLVETALRRELYTCVGKNFKHCCRNRHLWILLRGSDTPVLPAALFLFVQPQMRQIVAISMLCCIASKFTKRIHI